MSTPLPDRRRIEALERRNAQLEKELARGRIDQGKTPRQIFLAITERGLDSEGQPTESYPARASGNDPNPNAFPIKFLDPSFAPEEPGVAVFDSSRRKAQFRRQAVAISLGNKYYEEGTVVPVMYQRGKQNDPIGKWYIIDGAEAEQIIHFRLSEELSCGQAALAKRIRWNAGTNTFVDGETIRVYDDYGDRGVRALLINYDSQALANYIKKFRGWAAPRGSVAEDQIPEYSIIEIDHIAKFIEGPAIEAYSTGVYYISLQRWYDGQKPPVLADEAAINGKLLVTDSGDANGGLFFPRPPIGSDPWVKAIYDPCTGTYEVWNVQQLCPRFVVYSDAAACATGTIPIFADYYERLEFSPLDRVPPDFPPAVALNPAGFGVEAFDWMEIQWDDQLEDWIVVQVEHHQVDVLTNVQQDGCTLKGTKQTIYVSKCGGTQDATLVTFEEIVAVESLDWESSGSCVLKATLKAFCALHSDTDAGEQTVMTITCKTVVDDIFANSLGLYQFTTEIQQIAEASTCCLTTATEKVLDFTTCDPDSSGSS